MKRYWVIRSIVLPVLLTIPAHAAEIAITNTGPLEFGSFAAGSGGTVTVSPTGVCSSSGDVILIVSDSCASAEFTVNGDSSATYVIDLPADNFVKLSGPGNDMIINTFTSNPSGANGLIGAGGSQTLSVGGTLNIESNQSAGAYSGSFTVIVNYN